MLDGPQIRRGQPEGRIPIWPRLHARLLRRFGPPPGECPGGARVVEMAIQLALRAGVQELGTEAITQCAERPVLLPRAHSTDGSSFRFRFAMREQRRLWCRAALSRE